MPPAVLLYWKTFSVLLAVASVVLLVIFACFIFDYVCSKMDERAKAKKPEISPLERFVQQLNNEFQEHRSKCSDRFHSFERNVRNIDQVTTAIITEQSNIAHKLMSFAQKEPEAPTGFLGAGFSHLGGGGNAAPKTYASPARSAQCNYGESAMSKVNMLDKVAGGGLRGRFKTLKLDIPVQFEPTGKTGDSPAYEVFSDGVRLGAAWEKNTGQGEVYYSISIDDPSFDAPINLAAFQRDGGFAVVWSRPREKAAA